MTVSVGETIDNLMNIDKEELARAAKDGSPNRAVQSLVHQLQFVNLSSENGTFEQTGKNIGVQVKY